MVKVIHIEGEPCNKVEEWKVEQILAELKKDETDYIVGIYYCEPDGDYSTVLACIEDNGELIISKALYTEEYVFRNGKMIWLG